MQQTNLLNSIRADWGRALETAEASNQRRGDLDDVKGVAGGAWPTTGLFSKTSQLEKQSEALAQG